MSKGYSDDDLDQVLREVLTSERHFLLSTSAGQSKTQRNSKIREIIERRSKEVARDDT